MVSAILALTTTAQVSISANLVPTGLVQNSQLWNLTLINSGTAPMTVVVGLNLYTVTDNQPLLMAYSKSIQLPVGIKQVAANDATPIDYSFISPGFNFNRMPGSLLPVGSYRVCYVIFSGAKNAEGILTEECFNLEVAPLAPPQLILPADSAQLDNGLPQFSWIPPTPAVLFSDLNYDLLLTEVFPGQSAPQAVQDNLPVFTAKHLKASSTVYPASGKDLDSSKLYAWRVIANNGMQPVAFSEVWTFRVKGILKASKKIGFSSYVELKQEQGLYNTSIIKGTYLGIKFYSYEQKRKTALKILDESGNLIQSSNQSLVYGDNLFYISLNKKFETDKIYFIELVDSKGTVYRTSFRIENN